MYMLWNLLATDSEVAQKNNWITWVMLGAAALLIFAMMFFNRRTQKKNQQEAENKRSSIQPGCKVMTIGGICGVVVEVCPEDNTFVLETGSETTGKSYIKFDKIAIYQTDAQPAAQETPVEEAPVEEAPEEVASVEEAPFEEIAESKDADAESQE